MNTSQIKYARERLNAIKNERLAAAGPQYGYTFAEKEKLYADGKYSVQIVNGQFYVVFDGEKEYRDDTAVKRAIINKEYAETLDRIMLGDEAEALSLLAAFRGNV